MRNWLAPGHPWKDSSPKTNTNAPIPEVVAAYCLHTQQSGGDDFVKGFFGLDACDPIRGVLRMPNNFLFDSPEGQLPATTNRQPPTANHSRPQPTSNHHPPSTATNHQPPTANHCSVLFLWYLCLAHKAESVSVNVLFYWRCEGFFFLLLRTPLNPMCSAQE